MKILILKPSSLGDVVQALPVARLIRSHFPAATVDWWIHTDLVPLLADDPDIHRVIPFDRKAWGRPSGFIPAGREISRLRRERYDWVLDLQALARSAVVAWLTRGALTVGLDDRREGAPAAYDLAVPRPGPNRHAVEWYLAVLRTLKVPIHWNFEWLPHHPRAAAAIRSLSSGDETVWIALQPGARWMNKRWPITHYGELARRLILRNPRWRVAVLGGPGDRPLGAEITRVAGNRAVDLTGRLSLPEMIEFIRDCALMVTNDTGPMHVAAALRRPVLALFGPTDPARTGPYGQQDSVLQVALDCVPCLKSSCSHPRPIACLADLEVERVVREASDRLESARPLPCPDAPKP